MKKLMVMVLAISTMVSCEKEQDRGMVYFSIKTVDHVSGAVIPNVDLMIREHSYTGDTQNISTDENGIYSGTNAQNSSNLYVSTDNTMYMVVDDNQDVVQGEHVVLDLELMGIAELTTKFECSGGYIQNVQREMLNPISSTSPISGRLEGYAKGYYNVYCGATYSNQRVFASEWVYTYQKRPYPSSSWTSYSDTISITAGE